MVQKVCGPVKSRMVGLRLTPEERERLIELARSLERDPSDTIRLMIRRADVRVLAAPAPEAGEAVSG